MRYEYPTRMVCARTIRFDINDNVITNVSFQGGCDGNLKAVSKLVDGMTVDQIVSILGGNTCGNKPTSCADQLSLAVRAASAAEEAEKAVSH